VDLILHVGLTKTATTTLQKHFFSQLPIYRGRLKGSSAFEAWSSRRPDWRDEVVKWLANVERSDIDAALFSEEQLSRWPVKSNDSFHPLTDGWADLTRTRPHPMIEFLDAIQLNKVSDVRLRAIITIRRQADFLGSRYAQRTSSMRKPSQADFETKVADLLASGDPFCDWAALVEELQQVIEAENLLVLIHEDGLAHNVERLAAFLSVRFDSAGMQDWRENVKRDGHQAWKGPISEHGSWGTFLRVASERWPRSFRQGSRILKAVATKIGPSGARCLKRYASKEVRIVLSEELAADILRHYFASNVRLGALLDRDLSKVGYC
jgi:hypothetical protein